jgi:hypothetical protein
VRNGGEERWRRVLLSFVEQEKDFGCDLISNGEPLEVFKMRSMWSSVYFKIITS